MGTFTSATLQHLGRDLFLEFAQHLRPANYSDLKARTRNKLTIAIIAFVNHDL